jgi:hypothetical protein
LEHEILFTGIISQYESSRVPSNTPVVYALAEVTHCPDTGTNLAMPTMEARLRHKYTSANCSKDGIKLFIQRARIILSPACHGAPARESEQPLEGRQHGVPRPRLPPHARATSHAPWSIPPPRARAPARPDSDKSCLIGVPAMASGQGLGRHLLFTHTRAQVGMDDASPWLLL